MTIHAALSAMLLGTCDIYYFTASTGSALGDITRGYSATADVANQACLFRPLIGRQQLQSIDRSMAGEIYRDAASMVIADSVTVHERDKIVVKKYSDGTALSAAEQARHTYQIEHIADGRVNTGHLQLVLIPLNAR